MVYGLDSVHLRVLVHNASISVRHARYLLTGKSTKDTFSPIQSTNGQKQASIETAPKNVQWNGRLTKKQRLEHSRDIVFEPCHCRVFWSQIKSCLDLSLLTEAMVNDANVFSYLVYYALHRYRNTMEIELGEMASKLVGKHGPFYGYIDRNQFSHKYGHKFMIGKDGEALCESDITNVISRMTVCGWVEPGNFSRKYEVSEDENMVSLVMRLNKETTVRADAPRPIVDLCPTSSIGGNGIRYREADLTVLVGSGDGRKEFQCHSEILSFASAKLESLVAAASGSSLLLPDVKPEGFELFLKSIDPRQNNRVLNKNYQDTTNIQLLVPVYKSFEMSDSNYIKRCEDILVKDIDSKVECGVFNRDEVLGMLQLAIEHDLGKLKQEAEDFFHFDFGDDDLLDHIKQGSVDLKMVHDLVSLCLPIERKTTEDGFLSNRCPVLWQTLSSYIEDHLKSVMFHKVNDNDCEMFSHLVHAFLCHEASHN